MTRENLVEEELERITLGYYDHAIKGQSGIVELKRHERAWRSKLGQIMTGEEIDVAVAEYFLYVVKRDLWNRYLLNMLDGPIRPATRDVLEAWKNPLVLYGKVVAVKEDHFSVEELLGTETYHVGLEAGMKVAEGLLVFGIVLPDNRQWENGIHLQGDLRSSTIKMGCSRKGLNHLRKRVAWPITTSFSKRIWSISIEQFWNVKPPMLTNSLSMS